MSYNRNRPQQQIPPPTAPPSSVGSDVSVVRIKPYHYIHVVDNNTNVTKVIVGPITFTRQDHEKIVYGPEQMLIIPPRHYCLISNPVLRKKDGNPELDRNGNVKTRHGDEEIRLEQEPFPLFPGEQLNGKVTPLQVLAPNTALRLRATRDFEHYSAGDEWLFKGPGTYYPRVEVQIVEVVRATVIKPNEGLRIRAKKQCSDFQGFPRKAGEEWIVREIGAYLPDVDEEILGVAKGYTLTDVKALHMRAVRTFNDIFGKPRKAGEEWLVTNRDAEVYIPDVNEEVLGEVKRTTLNNRQYCVLLDPVGEDGKPRLGQKEVKRGEYSFFLRPGEQLEHGIQDVHILGEEEALLLRAKDSFRDGDDNRLAGDRWMIHGPTAYVPPIQVEILEKRSAIPLDVNEGIYVRDIRSGQVRSVIGQTYMLKANEELWAKELPKVVEELLSKERSTSVPRSNIYETPVAEAYVETERDKTRVVTYRAPHNSATQIYDYKEKKARVVFGPNLVMLGPDEHFTVISLSGDQPKRPHVIKSLSLLLGPDFMTDVVTVETADHARLSLKLAYNWEFEVDPSGSEEEAAVIFQVPDFVGDSCKAIASRVRGVVAAVPFDAFHKSCATIIRSAIFGTDESGELKNKFKFSSNNLVITNIDIQSVEPVDQRTRDSLQKSVQLAIEITTKSQEASARHEAERTEQEAKGRLERQRINDEAEAEKARKELLSLQAQSQVVEETGSATAAAKAKAEATQIEGQAAVYQAKLKADATKIKSEAELAQMKKRQQAELDHQRALNDLEINQSKEMSAIESKKFKAIVDAIGADTIASIAQAGPEMQAKLLSGLGLQSTLITDGHSPINLFNTASGLIGGVVPGGSQ